MKFLLYSFLVCAMALAKPMDEIKKLTDPSTSLNIKNETESKINDQKEHNNQEHMLTQIPTETIKDGLNPMSNINSNTENHETRRPYASDAKEPQVNPSVLSSQLTNIQGTDSSSSGRAMIEDNESVASPYSLIPNGLGSHQPSGLVVPSYSSGSYGIGSEPCAYSGLNGLSGSYGFPGSHGLLGSYGTLGTYGSHQPLVIPSSYSHYNPQHDHINIAKQIIHKPVITELQEVIHKPVISEVQEIVNKPVISEVQKVIHKPLYVEHIGLGPSYHGYQKHIVKQPIFHKPAQHFVHRPIAHAGTVHLADEYEHGVGSISATSINHGFCPPGTDSSYGFTGSFSPGIFKSSVMPSISSYGSSVYSSAGFTPVSSPFSHGPITPVSSSIGYSSSALADYSSSPYSGYSQGLNSEIPYGQPTGFLRTSNEESYKNAERKSQAKAAEQIMYDEFQLNDQQVNDNQQMYDKQIQQQFLEYQPQIGRNSEDSQQAKVIDVDTISEKIKENPEFMKQLTQIIAESMVVGEYQPQTGNNSKDSKQAKIINIDTFLEKIKKNPEFMKQLIKIIIESMGNSDQITQFDKIEKIIPSSS